jgi:hypothetical protein
VFYFYILLCASLFFLLSGLAVVLALAFRISSKEKRRDNPPDA